MDLVRHTLLGQYSKLPALVCLAVRVFDRRRTRRRRRREI